jgi:hypothetical protein
MQRFPQLPEWLSGESKPTLHQLDAFSKATSTPLGYFFLSEPPDERLPIPHFRSLENGHPHRPSPDLLETVQLMERRQAWMHEYLLEQGHEPLGFVCSAQLTIEPERSPKRCDEHWALLKDGHLPTPDGWGHCGSCIII